jgi:hypothetical protein
LVYSRGIWEVKCHESIIPYSTGSTQSSRASTQT